MSSRVFDWRRALGESRLTSTQKAIGLWLSTYMNAEDEAWPSVMTLGKVSGFGRRTVQNALPALVTAGFLVVVEKGGRGARDTTTYRAVLPTPRAQEVRPSGAEGRTSGQIRAHLTTEKGAPGAPEGVNEGVKEDVISSADASPPAGDDGIGWDEEPDSFLDDDHAEAADVDAPWDGEEERREWREMWWALVDACGEPETESEKGRHAFAAKALLGGDWYDATITPDDVRARAEVFRSKWPTADVTPTALAHNWSLLAPPARNEAARRENDDPSHHRSRGRMSPCEACGTGGGLHVEGCPQARRALTEGTAG